MSRPAILIGGPAHHTKLMIEEGQRHYIVAKRKYNTSGLPEFIERGTLPLSDVEEHRYVEIYAGFSAHQPGFATFEYIGSGFNLISHIDAYRKKEREYELRAADKLMRENMMQVGMMPYDLELERNRQTIKNFPFPQDLAHSLALAFQNVPVIEHDDVDKTQEMMVDNIKKQRAQWLGEIDHRTKSILYQFPERKSTITITEYSETC